MKKVIIINLNGRDYKIEEEGYQSLHAYLQQAEKRLKSNPDKEEILADFEQAIADKCDVYLSQQKTVITVKEIKKIIKDMGPVAVDEEKTKEKTETAESRQKKLYQIKEGAVISGVCMGLSAYFGIDVTIIRILFVVLTFLTHGGWILMYVIMMFVIPWATTSEQKAQARGEEFSADEFFKKSSAKYEKFRAKHILPKSISQEQFVENWRVLHHLGNRIGAICIGFIAGLLIWGWVLALIALFASGSVWGFTLGQSIPVWLTALYITSAFFLLFWPLKLWIRSTLVSAGVYKKDLKKSEQIINVLGWVGWTLSIIIFATLSINYSSSISYFFSHAHPIYFPRHKSP
jgi:phage shock protein PspC (stress-responsive transcriptional regulator)